ncbi:MAG: TetR/AcrR family transcriptional regulator [Bacteroidia bacterium]|nr:TetR/AcrR family transcriptional regulator [Bacteroidia bacterium]
MEQPIRNQILAASRKAFLREGFVGARMQAIADEAGISKALLHYHFKSKELLYQEAVNYAISQLQPVYQAFAAEHTSTKTKVTACLQEIEDIHQKQPELIQFLVFEAKNNFAGLTFELEIPPYQEVSFKQKQLFFDLFCFVAGYFLVQESAKNIYPQLASCQKLAPSELADGILALIPSLYLERYLMK